MYKHSIRKQFAVIFILLTAGTILVCYFMNILLLGKYYLNKKQKNLTKLYQMVDQAAANGQLQDEKAVKEIFHVANKHNISVVVINTQNELEVSILSNMKDRQQLMEYVYGLVSEPNPQAKVLKRTDRYIVQRSTETRFQTEYLEMWGILENGYAFLLRSGLESISESAHISNTFLLYTGLGITFVSALIIWFTTMKITKPITKLSDISKKMADLDFTEKYSGEDSNEIGELGRNVNVMSEVLEQTISELKQANLQLRKDIAEKEQIDAMRREFLSNVSHELKTPIALIQGYAEGLKECVRDDESSRDFYCEVIMDESAKMNRMVCKLLELNRLEFGNDVIQLEQFDIMQLIRNYVQSADILIKNHQAMVSVTPEGPIPVWADESRVEEVINNYFSNALNHLDGAGCIRIDVRPDTVAKKVRVSVFNTGQPIPEDSLEHIWEKFYKVDKARTREYGGSGVGLSIVKAIQDSMGQAYGVNNYEDGVEFWFELDAQSLS
ncbi:MAG: ATP-binding protein [Lachnospiraceae bacterium]